MNLKRDIQAYLKKTGLRPYQLADLAKVPRSSVYRLLKGQREVMLSTSEKLRKVIDRSEEAA